MNAVFFFLCSISFPCLFFFQDIPIHKFLKICHQIEGRVASSPTRTSEGNLESVLRKSIVDLSKAREEPLVRFLYLILDKLILLLVRPPIISGTVGKENLEYPSIEAHCD